MNVKIQTLELRSNIGAQYESRLEEEQGGNMMERRFFRTEARAKTDENNRMVIGGYGAVFNQYTNLGWYAEVVLPGFFDNIKDDRCACLFNHDNNQVLGRKKNDTLKLIVDANGLDYEAVPPLHRSDVYELIRDGYVYESSFAFSTLKTSWAEVDRSLLVGLLPESDLDQLSYGGKVTVRYLEKGKELFDVSPVTYGAYEGTSTDTRIARRSFDAWRAVAGMHEEQKEESDAHEADTKNRRAILQRAILRSVQ